MTTLIKTTNKMIRDEILNGYKHQSITPLGTDNSNSILHIPNDIENRINKFIENTKDITVNIDKAISGYPQNKYHIRMYLDDYYSSTYTIFQFGTDTKENAEKIEEEMKPLLPITSNGETWGYALIKIWR